MEGFRTLAGDFCCLLWHVELCLLLTDPDLLSWDGLLELRVEVIAKHRGHNQVESTWSQILAGFGTFDRVSWIPHLQNETVDIGLKERILSRDILSEKTASGGMH